VQLHLQYADLPGCPQIDPEVLEFMQGELVGVRLVSSRMTHAPSRSGCRILDCVNLKGEEMRIAAWTRRDGPWGLSRMTGGPAAPARVGMADEDDEA
jgi:hypothetical protein